MFRHVPNLLTGARLALALVFFVMLSFYQYDGRGGAALLNSAFIVYVVALVTDFLDGYLARKWKVEGVFGRVVDPYVDKILVLGTFLFFSGKNFIIQDPAGVKYVVYTITGVTPAMVLVILARELLVTTLRGMHEAAGQNFGAAFSGKVKMVLQSGTILVILLYVNYFDSLRNHDWLNEATIFRNVCIWATVIFTVLSGLMYIQRGTALYRGKMRAGG